MSLIDQIDEFYITRQPRLGTEYGTLAKAVAYACAYELAANEEEESCSFFVPDHNTLYFESLSATIVSK